MCANLNGLQSTVVFRIMMVSAIFYSTSDTFITFLHVNSLLHFDFDIILSEIKINITVILKLFIKKNGIQKNEYHCSVSIKSTPFKKSSVPSSFFQVSRE